MSKISISRHAMKVFGCPNCGNRIAFEFDSKYKIKPVIQDESHPRNVELPMLNIYETIYLDCPFCGIEMIDLDAEIADAIIMLWRAGISTEMCCQGHYHQTYGIDIDHAHKLYTGPFIDFYYSDQYLEDFKKIVEEKHLTNLMFYIWNREEIEDVDQSASSVVRKMIRVCEPIGALVTDAPVYNDIGDIENSDESLIPTVPNGGEYEDWECDWETALSDICDFCSALSVLHLKSNNPVNNQ